MSGTSRARSSEAKEQRRETLLRCALDTFYDNGFAASRIEDIAKRAGLSKGTVYLYFKNKDDLFEGLIESLTESNLEHLETMAQRAPTLAEALNTFARMMPVIIRTSDIPRLIKVLIGESQTFPHLVDRYRERVLGRVLAAITTLLRNADARGEASIEAPELVARLVVAPVLMSGIWEAVFARPEDTPVDLETLFRMHVAFLLSALTTETHS